MIASLCRSNSKGDIGFMKAPERLNVLISRARNCLILIGNMTTFMASPQGRDVWVPFMNLLKAKECLHDGLWVACEQHPDKRTLLMSPEDFEKKCPEGGCTDPCTAKLSCGLHKCRRQCHRMIDHSNTPCEARVEMTCEERQHKYSVPCHQRKKRCPECLKEEEAIRRRVKRDLDLEKKCLAREAQYLKELEEIQDEIAREKRLAQEEKDQKDRKDNLDKAQNELRTLRTAREQSEATKKSEETKKAAAATGAEQSGMSAPDSDEGKSDDDTDSECAKNDWKHQKTKEHAKSQSLDMLMDMIGLEEVKQKFLEIKASVDTALRQRISPRNERFSCVFLGNPGTGEHISECIDCPRTDTETRKNHGGSYLRSLPYRHEYHPRN